MAPRARFELATLRLTAECSTIELPGNGAGALQLILLQPADSREDQQLATFPADRIAPRRIRLSSDPSWGITGWKRFQGSLLDDIHSLLLNGRLRRR